MIRAVLARLRALFGSVTREDGDRGDRVEGSGEPYLDPAYNGRYAAERRLRQLEDAAEEAEQDHRH